MPGGHSRSWDKDHELELLLDYDGRLEVLPGGYYLLFRIRRVASSVMRPHGLRYSLTLHDITGRRLLGYDNAHGIARRHGTRSEAYDHRHRSPDDQGTPYPYRSASQLLKDFFDDVIRYLQKQGIDLNAPEERDEP